MRINHKVLITKISIGLIIAVQAASCGPSINKVAKLPAEVRPGSLIGLETCTYKDGKDKYSADCGTLVVPENRSDASSRLITLPVIRVRKLGTSEGEPILWLAGGPGGSNMDFPGLEGLVEDHDILMVGYRGVDGSVVLDCPEMAKAARAKGSKLLSTTSITNFGDATHVCARWLEANGVDLDGYTLQSVVEDMEAARKALGYQKVNLLSVSYGTRLAMIYAWTFPDHVSRSAMLAVNPPGHFVWEPEELDALFNFDANLCAQDAVCNARSDDLAETIKQVIKDLPDRWLFFPIDLGKVKFITQFLLFHRSTAAVAFDAYLTAEAGDPSGLALMSLAYDFMIPSMVTWGDWIAKGSGDYTADRDWLTEMNPENTVIGSPVSLLVGGSTQLGGGWPVSSIPDEYLSVQPSDIETLVVSGSVDYSTPASHATEELMPTLQNGKQVILSEFGHFNDVWKLQPEATRHLLVTFFENGEVDDSHFTYEKMNYKLGLMRLPLLAKVVMAIIILLPFLVVFVVKRFLKNAGGTQKAVNEKDKE
jgi:pimeloyl-ACP methyl ester carboxylesterase